MITEPTQLQEAILEALKFRKQHDEVEIGGINRGGLPTAKIRDPMRIDKMLRAKVIDEHQYAAGFYFAALYAISHKSEMTLSAYSGLPKEAFAQRIFAELGILGKIEAESLYHKVFRLMTPHKFRVSFQVCVNEMSVDELARCFQVRRKAMPQEIRFSLDELGAKIEQARDSLMKSFDSGKGK